MRYSFLVSLLIFSSTLFAQFPKNPPASELFHRLQKAGQTGSILYIAAHPDDENTRLISYFDNKMLARSAYLSLTRGDGGQNLIGTEIGAGVGVLRTQELLAARRIDGGEQFFTRAVDFGYSKSSDETLGKWGKEPILSDVVWVIRKFRPDVIITRFPPNNYAGHGHHEASALLAAEAFDAAADPNQFPEQLAYVDTWQPKRLYFNASSWWNKDIVERAQNSPDFITLNVGEYSPLLGESYAQIAARSRSAHKSQGFGSDYAYGLNIEYLEYVKGDKALRERGILDGIETGWERFGAAEIGEVLNKAIAAFDFKEPFKSGSAIAKALKMLKEEPESALRNYKIEELENLLLDLLGARIEVIAQEHSYAPGEEITVRLNAINNAPEAVKLVEASYGSQRKLFSIDLPGGELISEEYTITIPDTVPFTNPYWLDEPYEGIFAVSDFQLLGKPENDPIAVTLTLEFDGYQFNYDVPIQYKMVDPVKAVIYAPVQIVPAVTFNFSEDVLISANEESKKVILLVHNNSSQASGQVGLKLPEGWTLSPSSASFQSSQRGESKRFEFTLTPTSKSTSGMVQVTFDQLGFTNPQSLQVIDYDHIPRQIILKDASVELKSVDLARGDVSHIGYIDGPGDDVAKYLRTAGYTVENLRVEDLQAGNLNRFDAIIAGIRVYNTETELGFANAALNEYIRTGGTYLVQYNTSRGLKSESIGPFDFVISRERVTDETAEARFINPKHAVLNYPNKLSKQDFDHWVQERGLYFAGEWDKNFEPVISWNDPGEPIREGGLIVANYGDGHFVYSGISFFRELPAGVPGAYRLLANILALSKNGKKLND